MNNPASPITLKARYLFPIDGDPIPDGEVTIRGDTIEAVGQDLSNDARDLGNVALLPGLVNAHTHLEFSDVEVPLGESGMSLPDWIRLVVDKRRRQLREASDYAAARREAVEAGLQEAQLSGTVALGEIATLGWPEDAFDDTTIDATIFFEMIGRSSEQTDPLLHQAYDHFSLGKSAATPFRAGLSPHAPYSIHAELVARSALLSHQHQIPLTMHLAESIEELELLDSSSGPLREMLEDFEAWDPAAVPRGIRPLDYLQMLELAHRVLVVHGNFLAEDEIQYLGSQRDHMSVVYCPRTHAYFQHGEYPLRKLLDAGVAIALGTDSRASNPDLNLFAEMRAVAQSFSYVPLRMILEMGTIAGARALGLDNEYGSLTPGKRARLTCVPLPDSSIDDPHELLLDADPACVKPLVIEP